MSKLRWNSKPLMSRDFEGSSTKSNQEDSYQQFQSPKKVRKPFNVDHEPKAITNLKRSIHTFDGLSHSKSTKSVICDIRKVKPRVRPLHYQNQDNHENWGTNNQKRQLQKLLARTMNVLKEVHQLFDSMTQEFLQFKKFMADSFMQFSDQLIQTKTSLFSKVRKAESIFDCTEESLHSTKIYTPDPKRQIYQQKPAFETLREKITHPEVSSTVSVKESLKSLRKGNSVTYTSIMRSTNTGINDSSLSSRESSLSLEMKNRLKGAISHMKQVLNN